MDDLILDDSNDVQNNKPDIIIQSINEDDKLSIPKLIKTINNLAKVDEVQRARLIDQNKAVKDLLNKKQYSAAQKSRLREIFYVDDSDYDLEEKKTKDIKEQLMRDNKWSNKKKQDIEKEASKKALLEIIEMKKNEIKSLLGNPESKKKINYIFKVVSKCKESKSKNPASSEGNLKPLIEKIYDEEDSDNPFISQEKFEAILDPQEKYSQINLEKRAVLDVLVEKKKDKEEAMLESVNNLSQKILDLNKEIGINNNRYARIGKELSFANSGRNDADLKSWNSFDVDNFDLKNHIYNFINHCTSSCVNGKMSNPSQFIEISNIFLVLLNRITQLETLLAKTIDATISFHNVRNVEAKYGVKAVRKINKRLKLNKFLASNNKHYYDPKEWARLSAKDKIQERFKFKDYNLNPSHLQWNELTGDEKVGFHKLKLDYLEKRLVDLKQLYEKDKVATIKYFDNLKYYFLKDSKGFKIDVAEEIMKDYQMKQSATEIKNFLEEKWKEANSKYCIFNSVFYKGIKVACKGESALDTVEKYKKVLDKKAHFKKSNKYRKNKRKNWNRTNFHYNNRQQKSNYYNNNSGYYFKRNKFRKKWNYNYNKSYNNNQWNQNKRENNNNDKNDNQVQHNNQDNKSKKQPNLGFF